MNGAEQQSLPGMDMERVTFLSPSALERYRLCPRLYRFLYVDGLWRLSRSSAQQALRDQRARRPARVLPRSRRPPQPPDAAGAVQAGVGARRLPGQGAAAEGAGAAPRPCGPGTAGPTPSCPMPPSWASRPPGATSCSRGGWTGSTPTPTPAAAVAWWWSTTRPAAGRSPRRRRTPTRRSPSTPPWSSAGSAGR